MILFSTDSREPACRQILMNALGRDDSTVLVSWLWERHRSGDPSFADILEAVAIQTQQHGRGFAHNLLDMAKKPKEVCEAEMDIIAWAKPRLERAATTVMAHRGETEVAKNEYGNFCSALMEQLQRMFPDRHLAVLRGAIAVGLTHKNGQFSLDVATLVKAINTPMPV